VTLQARNVDFETFGAVAVIVTATIVGVVSAGIMNCRRQEARHVAVVWETKDTCRILVGKPLREYTLGRPRWSILFICLSASQKILSL
jgi:hypothetical protein